jgi:hypothetical protein
VTLRFNAPTACSLRFSFTTRPLRCRLVGRASRHILWDVFGISACLAPVARIRRVVTLCLIDNTNRPRETFILRLVPLLIRASFAHLVHRGIATLGGWASACCLAPGACACPNQRICCGTLLPQPDIKIFVLYGRLSFGWSSRHLGYPRGTR